MIANERVTLDDLERAGLFEGYRCYAPTGLCAGIDEQVAAGARCESCGHHGLIYRGFRRGSSYLAFAVCPKCDAAFEF